MSIKFVIEKAFFLQDGPSIIKAAVVVVIFFLFVGERYIAHQDESFTFPLKFNNIGVRMNI